MGRPANYNAADIKRIKAELRKYIDETEIPIVAGFAHKHGVSRQSLYDYEDFSSLINELIDKKESVIEEGTLTGKYNPSMAIFSLKQLGWSDKTQTELTGKDGGAVEIASIPYSEKIAAIAKMIKNAPTDNG